MNSNQERKTMLGRMRTGIVLTLFAVWICGQGLAQSPKTVVINEVLASNASVNKDLQGEYDDWIEIYNNTDKAVDVGGMYLTDDPAVPTKWQFPTGNPYLTTIATRAFLLVWADGQTSASGLHAGFKLDSDGETVGLFDKDGITPLDSVELRGQRTDVSYGRDPDDPNQWRYLIEATPKKANGEAYLGEVSDVALSHTRGLYDQPFSLEITTETPGALILYTLDGSVPCDAVGDFSPTARIYTSPIPITTTTCVRAVGYQLEWLATPVQTHTYLFIKDVVRQPKNPSGFPTSYGSWADYEMDPDITNSPIYGPLMEEALLSLPTLSIVMNNADLFGAQGIYTNPSRRDAPKAANPVWEKPASIELIYPDGRAAGFQIPCGITIQGGAFRTMSAKHSFRLLFKGGYGAAKLRYPLFGEDATEEFDTIILRAGANDGYSWNAARYTEQYTRDEFGRDLQRATGNAGSHGTFAHLYLNGLYWGLYNPCERPDESFSASYYRGEKEDWDALHYDSSSQKVAAIQGDLTAWNQMIAQCREAADSNAEFLELQGRSPDGTCNPAYPILLDVQNYIDYLIVNVWGGNWDWPWKNWYAARDRTAYSTGFKFYCWDYENTMGNNLGRSPLNKNALNNDFSSAGEPHQYLRQNAEYRMLFADHVHRFFFNKGVLTPESLIPRYESLAEAVELAIVTESARWGDQHFHPPLTQEDWYDNDQNYNDGRAGRGWIMNYYLPQRTAIVLQQFKDAGLYPKVDAPVFKINGSTQHGGQTPSNAQLTMTAPAGKIYYTLDGSDPRQPAMESPSTGTTLVAAGATKRVLVPTSPINDDWRGGGAFDDSSWTPVTGSPGGIGFDANPSAGGDYRPYLSLDLESQMYGTGKGSSSCIRIPFTLSTQDLAQFNSLTLRMLYDDGFVAYLNGTEIQRTSFNGTPAWNSRASSSHDAGTASTSFDVSGFLDKLHAGDNILAIHGLNSSSASTDFLIWAELMAAKTAVPSGIGISPTAVEYEGPVTLDRSVLIKSRVLSGTTWSALNEAVFAVGPVAETLRISEIMYHPQDTGNPIDPHSEFIELTNVGSQTLHLNLVRFTKGIDFTFGDVELLPGKYILVVKDVTAFTARYGPGLPITGAYTGSLDNAGERLQLQDAAGKVIHDFQYSDGWYKATDGDGFSLTVKNPADIGSDPGALGDKGLWQPSQTKGGSPGS